MRGSRRKGRCAERRTRQCGTAAWPRLAGVDGPSKPLSHSVRSGGPALRWQRRASLLCPSVCLAVRHSHGLGDLAAAVEQRVASRGDQRGQLVFPAGVLQRPILLIPVRCNRANSIHAARTLQASGMRDYRVRLPVSACPRASGWCGWDPQVPAHGHALLAQAAAPVRVCSRRLPPRTIPAQRDRVAVQTHL